MHKLIVLMAAMMSAVALPSLAQQPAATGGTVITSEPGRAGMTRTAQISAQVVAVDAATRVVSLKGPSGNVVDVVAGDEVRNFAQIKVGDFVVVRYLQALTLQLKKTKSGVRESTEREGAARAAPGERPAGAAARQVTVIADVTHVDPKARTITLKGPKGRFVTLDVQNPEQFKVVKVGDQVEAVYTEAVAISVEPSASAAGKAGAAKK